MKSKNRFDTTITLLLPSINESPISIRTIFCQFCRLVFHMAKNNGQGCSEWLTGCQLRVPLPFFRVIVEPYSCLASIMTPTALKPIVCVACTHPVCIYCQGADSSSSDSREAIQPKRRPCAPCTLLTKSVMQPQLMAWKFLAV